MTLPKTPNEASRISGYISALPTVARWRDKTESTYFVAIATSISAVKWEKIKGQ
jgi:hypothetical protein